MQKTGEACAGLRPTACRLALSSLRRACFSSGDLPAALEPAAPLARLAPVALGRRLRGIMARGQRAARSGLAL